jgi:hypothetical protein
VTTRIARIFPDWCGAPVRDDRRWVIGCSGHDFYVTAVGNPVELFGLNSIGSARRFALTPLPR